MIKNEVRKHAEHVPPTSAKLSGKCLFMYLSQRFVTRAGSTLRRSRVARFKRWARAVFLTWSDGPFGLQGIVSWPVMNFRVLPNTVRRTLPTLDQGKVFNAIPRDKATTVTVCVPVSCLPCTTSCHWPGCAPSCGQDGTANRWCRLRNDVQHTPRASNGSATHPATAVGRDRCQWCRSVPEGNACITQVSQQQCILTVCLETSSCQDVHQVLSSFCPRLSLLLGLPFCLRSARASSCNR